MCTLQKTERKLAMSSENTELKLRLRDGLKLQLLQKMGVESLNVMLQLVCFFIT
ncbi:unnamed protein product [Brassica oleracea]|uniref:(rape) hypothetical protein n=1 Tax=Brassica napus TaxID=3708 RepID=A0A816J705_BRANA|nr:unnamed protein product [Brassica napus]